jgi:hypothetical protein
MLERGECCQAARVYYKHIGRWPTNMIELLAFTHSSSDKSLGPFDPSFYKNETFTQRADGNPIIESQRNGLGNVVVDVDRP